MFGGFFSCSPLPFLLISDCKSAPLLVKKANRLFRQFVFRFSIIESGSAETLIENMIVNIMFDFFSLYFLGAFGSARKRHFWDYFFIGNLNLKTEGL